MFLEVLEIQFIAIVQQITAKQLEFVESYSISFLISEKSAIFQYTFKKQKKCISQTVKDSIFTHLAIIQDINLPEVQINFYQHFLLLLKFTNKFCLSKHKNFCMYYTTFSYFERKTKQWNATDYSVNLQLIRTQFISIFQVFYTLLVPLNIPIAYCERRSSESSFFMPVFIFIMRSNQKVCYKVVLKNQQDFHLFKIRASHHFPHTPKLLLGKTEGFYQEIYTEHLTQQPLPFLKDLNSTQKAFIYARSVVQACINLACAYGYFIINENMVFLNSQLEIVVWINPEIMENHVKIYLPPTPQGEQAMIRSIIIFLKLWLRCDFALLSQSLHLPQLLEKLKPLKVRPYQYFSIKTEADTEGSRRNSVNLYDFKLKRKQSQSGSRQNPQRNLGDNIFNKFAKRHSNHFQTSEKSRFLKSKQHINESMRVEKSKQTLFQHHKPKGEHYQHQTFANVYELPHSKTAINESLGLKSYFPNKTTSNKNHIVQMIMEYDENPDEFGKNNLVMEEQREDRAKLRKLKESLHGMVGQQLNDLFESAILDEDKRKILDSFIQKQFQNLLE